MDNRDYARVLSEIADLMQIKGANRFRIRAFENAARAIETLELPLESVIDDGDLTTIKGIGEGIAAQIYQIRDQGTCDQHRELIDELDAGLLDLLKIQGLGPKRIKTIYQELDITDLQALEQAAEAGRISALSGFGAKTEEKILTEIARLKEGGGRVPLPRAKAVAQSLRRQLLGVNGVQSIEIAGSVRRGRETVGDLDLLVATDDPDPVHAALRELTEVAEVLASGQSKTSVRLHNGIQVDLRAVEPPIFGSALHYFTGSKEHHVALRTRAKRQGLKISEYGVFREGQSEPIASGTEEELYAALGLAYIPPELRRGGDEIDLAAEDNLPQLIDAGDVRGDLHMHTTETDGKASITEMAQAARERGYQFVAITDHSQAVTVANGMNADRFAAQIEEIRRLDADIDGIRIFAGIEVDILKEGDLDMDHQLLAQCDWVVASVHSHFNLSKQAMTDRLIKAVETGLISCLGHPTGRILGGRGGYEYDFDAVVDCAVEYGVALELNGSTGRLDLNGELAARAHHRGARFVLGSDAHSTRGLEAICFAVQQARRAALPREAILNCLDADAFPAAVTRPAAH